MKRLNAVSLIREIGPVAFARGSRDAANNALLRHRYGFAPWHVRATYDFKPYKRMVVEAVTELRPRSVLEIGCGLGDIVSRVPGRIRVGLDADPGAVNAARRLHPQVAFERADLNNAVGTLQRLDMSQFDVLIMVNWPHLVSPAELVVSVKDVQAATNVGYLVIDLIHPETAGYLYAHTIRELEKLGKVAKVVRAIDPVRDLAVVALAKASDE